MDKKGGFSDIKILFLTLVLFSVGFLVYSSLVSIALLDFGSSTTVIAYGGSDTVDNGTAGGQEETINLTVAHDGTGVDNITHINITLPAANYTFETFISGGDIEEDSDNSTLLDKPDERQLSNVSFYSDGTTALTWGCYNITLTELTCNTTEATGTEGPDALGGGNTSLTIMFNVTAASDRTEHIANIQIDVSNDSVFDPNSTNTTFVNLTIDGRFPRLLDLNISDGNTTLVNSTHLGVTPVIFVINETNYLSNDTNITVTIAVQENNIDTILLYYNCTSEQSNVSSVGNTGDFFVPAGSSNYSFKAIQGSGTTGVEISTETIAFTGTIDSTCTGTAGTNYVSLLLFLNDTYNNNVEVNYTGGDPFAFSVNGSGDGRPTFYNANVTDGTNTLADYGALDGNSDYLATGNHTFSIEYSGENTNITTPDVLLVYNLVNSSLVDQNGFIFEESGIGPEIVKSPTLDNNTVTDNSTRPAVLIAAVDFIANTNKSTNVTFAWIANSTIENKADSLYTVVAGPFSYVIDGAGPAPTLTEPSDTSIDVRATIKYTCSGTDTESGVSTYATTITKPGGNTVTKSTTVVDTEVSFTGDDTNEAGTYTVECKLTDAVGNVGTTSNTFTALYTTGAAAPSGGAGGRAAEGVTFDVDFSQALVTEASVKVAEGSSRTFSFDGLTTHSLKVDALSDTAATVTVSSDAQTFILNVGESRKVDLNHDGLNDVDVMLNSISSGVADISLKKIEEGAAVVAEEEKAKAEEEAARGVTPTEEVTPAPVTRGYGTTIAVVVILIIVVLLVVYYFMRKK